jgi:ribonucleotide reductase class II
MNIIGAVVVAGNVRRCLPGDTLVQVNKTEWKKIMDMSKEDLIYIDGEFHKVNATFDQGEQEVYKVELSDGTFVEATPNHRWYVFDETDNSMKWVETQYLSDKHSMVDPT